MSLRVCVAGATGWVGRPLSVRVARSPGLRLVAAVSRKEKGRKLSAVIGENMPDITVSGSVSEALTKPVDVLVDYTGPGAAKANALAAIRRGVSVVIGSSGLTDRDFAHIHLAALRKRVGVIAVGNFSIAAMLLHRFALDAAKRLGHWEIIDYASDRKVDAPSGTVRELAHLLDRVRRPRIALPIEKTVGLEAARGATLNGTQVHSLRLPGYTIGVEVVFAESEERLTLRYDAGRGPEPYLATTISAVRRVRRCVGLVRGFEAILP